MLNIFDKAAVRGTFFVLGWIAERFPSLIKRVAQSGHEIASHGYWHRLVYDLSPDEFKQDILDSREAIFNACQIEVNAYRAPSFSIVPRSRWALNVLSKHGFEIDSSIFPISGHDRYGDPDSPASIHTIKTETGSITEFPPTAGSIFRFPLPVGGGYFRLFPLWLTQTAIRQTRQQTGPAMFYIHPWEVDPDQPRITGVGFKSRFRHYVGLRRTKDKLERLLQNNSFGTMTQVLDAHAASCKASVTQSPQVNFGLNQRSSCA